MPNPDKPQPTPPANRARRLRIYAWVWWLASVLAPLAFLLAMKPEDGDGRHGGMGAALVFLVVLAAAAVLAAALSLIALSVGIEAWQDSPPVPPTPRSRRLLRWAGRSLELVVLAWPALVAVYLVVGIFVG